MDYFKHTPDHDGYFAEYGGALVPEVLQKEMQNITDAYYSMFNSMLKDKGRVHYVSVTDRECLDAFFELSKKEGIIPALESAHAVAYATKLAQEHRRQSILVNLSGRGDKDIDFVVEEYGKDYGIDMMA